MPALFIAGCKQEEKPEPEPVVGCNDPAALNYAPDAEDEGDCTYPVLRLHIHQMVGNNDLALNTNYTINGTVVQFETVNFYLDEIALMDMDMNMSDRLDTTILVKVGTMDYELGTITTGHKHMLMFNLGVDSVDNHADPALLDTSHPLSYQSPSMHWSWDNGYIFLRIDGQVDTDGDDVVDAPMVFHIGNDNYLVPVTLMSHSEAETEDFEIRLDFDVVRLFEGVDLSTENQTKTGNDPVLARKVADNIAAAFSKQ
jgi:hypothetical protein